MARETAPKNISDLILRSLGPQGQGVSKDGNTHDPPLLPSFETLASLAPQDEVRDLLQALSRAMTPCGYVG
jgi:hypothetical protein